MQAATMSDKEKSFLDFQNRLHGDDPVARAAARNELNANPSLNTPPRALDVNNKAAQQLVSVGETNIQIQVGTVQEGTEAADRFRDDKAQQLLRFAAENLGNK